MKAINRIISIVCAVTVLFGSVPASVSAALPAIYVNEEFDNIATNAAPENITIKSGLNSRVVEISSKNKALYSAADGCAVKLNIPLSNQSAKMVFSYDIMISGSAVKGSAMELAGTSKVKLLEYKTTREIFLEDGMRISGYSPDKWQSYTFAVDFDSASYDMYIDGKLKLSNRRFKSGVSKPTGINFSFNCSSEEAVAEIYLDNIRVYEGDEPLSSKALPGIQYNSDAIDFIPAERNQASGEKIYIDSNSKNGISAAFTAKTTNVAKWDTMEKGGTSYIHLIKNDSSDTYCDVTTDIDDGLTKFVYQTDVFIVKNSNTIHIARAINRDEGLYGYLLKLDGSSGALSYGSTTVGSVEFGKWVTLAVAVDTLNETVTVYKNGSVLKSDIPLDPGTASPKEIRIGFPSGSGSSDIYLNRIKLYEGTKLREFNDAQDVVIDDEDAYLRSAMKTTLHEKLDDVSEILGTDKVFMTTSDYFYANGQKLRYSDYGSASYLNSDGKIMVDTGIVEFAFDEKGSVNDGTFNFKNNKFETEIKDGVYYTDICAIAKKLGKVVYDTDNRSFAIISDTNKKYSNSIMSDDNIEPTDSIWRYLQFDRLTTDEVYKLVCESPTYKSHPRLYIRKDEIAGLRARINDNEELKKMLDELLDACDLLLTQPPQDKVFQADGFRTFGSCSNVKKRLTNLCTAYLITGDQKYAERAWQELDYACNWSDWNLEAHFLDSGEIAPGIAFAYDTLYDYLSEEQKKSVRQRVDKLYLDYCVGMFTGSHADKVTREKYLGSNWGAVTGAAMLMTTLSFIDEEEPDSLLTEKCKYIISNVLQTFEYMATALAPEGAWNEGGGYAEYLLQHFAWAALCLENVLGTDNGFLSAPGVADQPIFAMYTTTKNGVYNRAGTTGTGKYFAPESFVYARLLNKPGLMQLYHDYRKSIELDDGFGANYLLFYDPDFSESSENTLSTDRYFHSLGMSVSRGSWTDDDGLYVAVNGGTSTSYGNGHLDKGSFIFESLGQRWFIDLGRNGNNIMPFLKRAEVHNSMVINPTADDKGQLMNKAVLVSDSEYKERGAKFEYDLAPVYSNDVSSYKRGFLVSDERNTLVVQDELTLKAQSELMWNYITTAEVEISEDGKSAILTQNGKKLKVTADSTIANWKFELRDLTPTGGWVEDDEGKGHTVEEQKNFVLGKRKLVIIAKTSGNVKMAVKFSPVVEGATYPDASLVPMSEWAIPDGHLPPKAVLENIYADGKPLPDFVPGIKEYYLKCSYGSTIPVFTATAAAGKIEITQPADWTDQGIIRITLDDGQTAVYRINLSVDELVSDNIMSQTTVLNLPDNAEFADINSVYATHEPQQDNPAANVADGKLETRWAADTSGAYIELDLGSVKDLSGIALAWASGQTRNYKFDILVSEDKMNYKRIYSGYSLGGTNDYEFLEANVKARYIRYIGYGHKDGDWNSVTEISPVIFR